ncbi:anthrone oxygenase family protein [Sphingomonas psychrotolerans]|uniref:DUF1772 domain-containing protein n=1 Tax=Sphingomonas psychrotolerans TaxID=1327635 RepID=A0A2K8MHG2_9SPHN|nr:anthrone oxygenase family protein [Sphingomonas psychrotolerans]ATY33293.1 hypothetical protein CVN68_16080 [Sphingomonas psychrotolerans]
MGKIVVPGLLWFSAIGCGLIAGLYFAFSTFILQALNQLGPAPAAQAMNAINARILQSLFMPLFLGTTLAGLALAVIGAVNRDEAGATAMLSGGAIYAIGMFGVTMAFNVPLNNALTREAAALWPHYLRRWALWNHVRMLASAIASALFILAIAAR